MKIKKVSVFTSIVLLISMFTGIAAFASQEAVEEDITVDVDLDRIASIVETPDGSNDFIYVDKNNVVHSNKDSAEMHVQFIKPDENGLFEWDGQIVSVPKEMETTSADIPDLSTDSGTGAYRKVKSYTGYRKASGYADTPSASNIDMNGTDLPYLYLGGHTTSGGDYDAGLIYSPAKEKWYPFINNMNGMLVYDDIEIPTGNEAFLQTYIPQDDQVALYFSYNGQSDTYIRDIATWANFNQNGSGVQMKRVSSIAQSPENLNSGSKILGGEWDTLRVYNTSTAYTWTSTKTSEKVRYPNDSRVTYCLC